MQISLKYLIWYIIIDLIEYFSHKLYIMLKVKIFQFYFSIIALYLIQFCFETNFILRNLINEIFSTVIFMLYKEKFH